MKGGVLMGCAIVLLSAGWAMADIETIANGGFESGLTGWTNTVNVVALPAWGLPVVTPHSGAGMAVMSPLGVLNSTLGQNIDLQGLSQVNVSFWYQIQSLDLPLFGDAPADPLSVQVGDAVLPLNLGPFSSNDPAGGANTTTGWQFFTTGWIPASSLGPTPHSIRFLLDNQSSLNESTIFFIDDVSVLAAPEPASIAVWLLLGAAGLATVRGWRRKWSGRPLPGA